MVGFCWVTPKSHSQYLQIVILTNHQIMPEWIFHEMHHRRNIDLRRLQIKRSGRLGPRAVLALDCCVYISKNVHYKVKRSNRSQGFMLRHILLRLIPIINHLLKSFTSFCHGVSTSVMPARTPIPPVTLL